MHTHSSPFDFCYFPTWCQIGDQHNLDKFDDNDIAAESPMFEEEEMPTATVHLDKDTIVIGNGPAGIAISAILSGWHPFYDLANPHPNPQIHEMLCQFGDESLLFQDLSPLSDLLQTDLNQNLSPFAALYDALVRPIANDPSCRSCLKWRRIPTERVDHLVLGDSPVGGSWTEYEDEMTTVSISNWMDLPGFSLAHDFLSNPEFAAKRPNVRQFRDYLLTYCLVMDIEANFKPYMRLTQIQKLCDHQSGLEFWELKGVITTIGEPFKLRCRNVVMACGQSHPRQLGVPGETESSSHLVYDLSALKHCLGREENNNEEGQSQFQNDQNDAPSPPVVVIGDGISAADAVLSSLIRGCPVLHVIRRNERQLRNVMLSRLSASVYPEYAAIYQLMIGKTSDPNYTRITGTNVIAVNDGEISLERADGNAIQQKFRCLAICIGRRSELPLLRGSSKFDEFSTNYQSTTDSSLFAIGAMAGDHFVRYLVGGALRVGQTLMNAQRERRWEWESRMACRTLKCAATTIDFRCEGGRRFGRKKPQKLAASLVNGSPKNGGGVTTTIPRTNSATPLVRKPESIINRAKSTMHLSVSAVAT